MIGAKELQVIWVPWRINTCVCGVKKYVSFPRITARNILWFELILLRSIHISPCELLLLPKIYSGPFIKWYAKTSGDLSAAMDNAFCIIRYSSWHCCNNIFLYSWLIWVWTCFFTYTNFEFTYVKISMFIVIKPELLKTSAPNVVSKIINFGWFW